MRCRPCRPAPTRAGRWPAAPGRSGRPTAPHTARATVTTRPSARLLEGCQALLEGPPIVAGQVGWTGWPLRALHGVTAVNGPKRRVHFVGIGGIGMSGIAEVLLTLGYSVSGSDVVENENARRLEIGRASCRGRVGIGGYA